MARIRTIKPEFWSSPDTARLDDPWARLLFIAMWNWADDNGRRTANPKELAGFAFPNDDGISSADIRRMLGGIRRAFGVILYEVGGRPYYAIPSWELHQKIDRRSTGRYPTPEEGSNWDPDPPSASDLHERNGQVRSSENPAESPPRARSEPGAGSWNRGTGEQGKEPPRAAAENVSPDRGGRQWVSRWGSSPAPPSRRSRRDPGRVVAARRFRGGEVHAEDERGVCADRLARGLDLRSQLQHAGVLSPVPLFPCSNFQRRAHSEPSAETRRDSPRIGPARYVRAGQKQMAGPDPSSIPPLAWGTGQSTACRSSGATPRMGWRSRGDRRPRRGSLRMLGGSRRASAECPPRRSRRRWGTRSPQAPSGWLSPGRCRRPSSTSR